MPLVQGSISALSGDTYIDTSIITPYNNEHIWYVIQQTFYFLL